MESLAKAKEILDGAVSGYSTGRIEDSEVAQNTSIEQYTDRPVLRDNSNHNVKQLALLRKRRKLNERIRQHQSEQYYGHDSDPIGILTKDVPNFHDEVSVSRQSAYSRMNPFTAVAKNGRRV